MKQLTDENINAIEQYLAEVINNADNYTFYFDDENKAIQFIDDQAHAILMSFLDDSGDIYQQDLQDDFFIARQDAKNEFLERCRYLQDYCSTRYHE